MVFKTYSLWTLQIQVIFLIPERPMEVFNPCEILMLWPLAKWVCIGAVVLHMWVPLQDGWSFI